MIDTPFQIKRKVEAHMNAPLLKERELFLSKKQAKGNGLRSLQMTADQLLYAIHYLSLTKVFIQLHIISVLSRKFCKFEYLGNKVPLKS